MLKPGKRLKFNVRSQRDDTVTYQVSVATPRATLTVRCDCRAGQNGNACHHVINLLRGNQPLLVRPSQRSLKSLTLLMGRPELRPLSGELDRLIELEDEEDAKKRMQDQRKLIGEILREGVRLQAD